jgi:hypothetical protein
LIGPGSGGGPSPKRGKGKVERVGEGRGADAGRIPLTIPAGRIDLSGFQEGLTLNVEYMGG